MPTYEYACRDCGHHVEVVQSFRDDPLTVCGACGGSLRKVFSAAGIIFKGSGYYVTDSRKTPDKGKTPDKAKDKGKGKGKARENEPAAPRAESSRGGKASGGEASGRETSGGNPSGGKSSGGTTPSGSAAESA